MSAKECWICKQKAEWKHAKIKAAREKAQAQANESGKTMAIVREGCNYNVVTAIDGLKVVEFVSANTPTFI